MAVLYDVNIQWKKSLQQEISFCCSSQAIRSFTCLSSRQHLCIFMVFLKSPHIDWVLVIVWQHSKHILFNLSRLIGRQRERAATKTSHFVSCSFIVIQDDETKTNVTRRPVVMWLLWFKHFVPFCNRSGFKCDRLDFTVQHWWMRYDFSYGVICVMMWFVENVYFVL